MVRHIENYSELWISIPWKKLRKNLFRLQCRLWKAIRSGDRKRANSLQKLILKSRSARLRLIKKAFPVVGYSQHKHVLVKGDASPFNRDLVYWSKRESLLYDGATAKALNNQNHKCGHCGLKFTDGETIHLHHVDGNHHNWKLKNLLAVHQSCHQYIHISKKGT